MFYSVFSGIPHVFQALPAMSLVYDCGFLLFCIMHLESVVS